MKLAIFLLGFVLVVAYVDAQGQSHDTVEREEIGEYVSTITHNNHGDSVELRDKIGNLVFSCEIFLDKDIEVDRPAGRNACLIKQASNNATCFNESPVTVELPDEVKESCKGRELVKLEPADCDDEHPGKKDEAPSRERRQAFSTCCRYTCWNQRHCRATRCCRRFLFICTKRCCTAYDYRRICSRKCVHGATSQY